MSRKKISKLNSELLRQKLKLKNLQEKSAFLKKYPSVDLSKIRSHSAKAIGAGALAGSLFLAPPATERLLPAPESAIVRTLGESTGAKTVESFLGEMEGILPEKVGPLTRDQEKHLEQVFKENLEIESRATLEGEHLNTTYGYIGVEQHLRRYPGDILENHGEGLALRQGMAPGLGAWGYFARSKAELTPELVETEKWYAVVQTLYLPDWNTRQPYLRDWYKHRKVLIVNPENGKAVVAAIADSGPAAWTGKHYGGSPEVMQFLGGEKGYKYTKGNVVLFFVDDAENKIKLGPVNY